MIKMNCMYSVLMSSNNAYTSVNWLKNTQIINNHHAVRSAQVCICVIRAGQTDKFPLNQVCILSHIDRTYYNCTSENM